MQIVDCLQNANNLLLIVVGDCFVLRAKTQQHKTTNNNNQQQIVCKMQTIWNLQMITIICKQHKCNYLQITNCLYFKQFVVNCW